MTVHARLDHPTATRTGRDRVAAWTRLLRPEYWPLAIVPLLVGTRLGDGGPSLPRLLLACAVAGPGCWTAVFVVNDLSDLPGDRLNPRKAGTPLVTGAVSIRHASCAGVVAAVAALAGAALIAPCFLLGTTTVLLLGCAYSCSPVRLKGRAVLDVATNAIVVGAVAPLGGWSLSHPVGDFPWPVALLGVLSVAALYLPTLVVDSESDKVAGDLTTGVRFSASSLYAAGLVLWTLACVLSVWCVADGLVPWPLSSGLQGVAAAVALGTYAALLREPSFSRLTALCSVLVLPIGLTLLGGAR